MIGVKHPDELDDFIDRLEMYEIPYEVVNNQDGSWSVLYEGHLSNGKRKIFGRIAE